MASKTISQRISLEGGEEFRKKLEDIGTAGEKSFKQIATAGQNAKIDPQQFDRVKQALDNLAAAGSQLGQQLQQLGQASASFGTAGTQAAQQVTTGLQQTGTATQQTATGFKSAAAEANNLGIRIGIVAGITEAATSKLLGFVNTLRAALAPGALLKGVVDTGNAIHDQAEELNLSVAAWLKLRQALSETSVSTDDAKTALEKLTTTIDDAKGGIGRLGASTQQVVKFADGHRRLDHQIE